MCDKKNNPITRDFDLEEALSANEVNVFSDEEVTEMLASLHVPNDEGSQTGILAWLSKLNIMTSEEKLQTVELTGVKFYKGMMVLSWNGAMGFGEYLVKLDEDETTLIGHSEDMDIKKPNKEFLRHLLGQLADKVDLTEEISSNEDWKKRNGD